MVGLNYKTKAALKKAVGEELKFVETSLYGVDYPKGGSGKVTGVGPDAYNNRKFYARVTLEDHKIVKVI